MVSAAVCGLFCRLQKTTVTGRLGNIFFVVMDELFSIVFAAIRQAPSERQAQNLAPACCQQFSFYELLLQPIPKKSSCRG
jgi:hypothetical protein